MRRLAAAALGFAGGIAFAEYLGYAEILCSVAAGLGAVLGIYWMMKRVRWVRRFAVVALAAAVGAGWFLVYEAVFYAPAASLDGETRTVRAVVTDYPVFNDYGSTVEVELLDQGGARVIINMRARFVLRPGDVITLEASFKLPEKSDDFDALAFYKARRVFLLADNVGEAVTVERRSGIAPRFYPAEARHALQGMLDTLYAGEALGLARALTTGDRSAMPPALKLAVSAAGLAHAVSISGQHIAILAGMVLALMPGRRRAAAFVIPIIIGFVLICGASPSAIRACVMYSLALLALLVRRESDAVTSLSGALALLLLVNPFSITDVGLQLSFAASLGLVLCLQNVNEFLLRPFEKRGRRVRAAAQWFTLTVSSSVIATVFTAPLCALYFGTLPLYGVAANVLTLWTLPVGIVGGLLSGIFAFCSPTLARHIAGVVTYLYEYVARASYAFARLPYQVIDMRSVYNIVWLVSAYCTLAVWRLGRERGSGPVAAALVCAAFVCAAALDSAERRANPTVTILSVGQGQSVVARDGDAVILVDCGGTVAGSEAATLLLGSNIHRADALVLTHCHYDHAGGLETLLRFVDIGRAYLPAQTGDDSGVIALLEANGVEVRYIDENVTLEFGECTATLFRPVRRSSANEQGSAVRLSYGRFDMLIMGDLNGTSEFILTGREDLGGTDVLLVGHHGSKWSTSDALLSEIAPAVSIISVGKNSYGHPATETLMKLNSAASDIYRTDMNGNLTIRIGKEVNP